MKHHIDEFIAKSIGMINAVLTILAAMTVIDWMDVTVRIITGVISIAIGLLVFRHYRLKIKLIEKEIELKDQEIGQKLMEIKNRSNGKV